MITSFSNLTTTINSFPVKLGIIGMSKGNGHPYSWSAIVNGYDPSYMKHCPFPSIPEYLSKSNANARLFDSASVTHVWTHDPMLSKHIADSCFIPNVVDKFEDMVGKVDAILLARDDAENHLYFSSPFLSAGLPVYIDKPLSYSIAQALFLLSMQKYESQIFSCSALRFAREFNPSSEFLEALGPIMDVKCVAPKNWSQYSIHIIEPFLNLFQWSFPFVVSDVRKSATSTTLYLSNLCGLTASISTISLPDIPFKIDLVSSDRTTSLVFTDSYEAFRNSLLAFLSVITGKNSNISRYFTLDCVRLIEAGL